MVVDGSADNKPSYSLERPATSQSFVLLPPEIGLLPCLQSLKTSLRDHYFAFTQSAVAFKLFASFGVSLKVQ
jgi:hypothetical protein